MAFLKLPDLRYPAAMRHPTRLAPPLLALPFLAACAPPPQEAPAPGMPNPAAVFCIKSGGTVVPKETAQGTQGWCHLPSGLMVEEWAFYTAAQG